MRSIELSCVCSLITQGDILFPRLWVPKSTLIPGQPWPGDFSADKESTAQRSRVTHPRSHSCGQDMISALMAYARTCRRGVKSYRSVTAVEKSNRLCATRDQGSHPKEKRVVTCQGVWETEGRSWKGGRGRQAGRGQSHAGRAPSSGSFISVLIA